MTTSGGKVVLSVTVHQREALRLAARRGHVPATLYRAVRSAQRKRWLAGEVHRPSLTPSGQLLHALLERLAASERHS